MDIALLLRMSEQDRFLKLAELLGETQLAVLDYVQGQARSTQLIMERLASTHAMYSFMIGSKDLDESAIIKMVYDFIQDPTIPLEHVPKFPKLKLVK